MKNKWFLHPIIGTLLSRAKKIKLPLPIKRSVIILSLSMMTLEVFSQNDTVINRYFVIEFDNDPTPLTTPLENSDPGLLFALKTNLLFDALTAINFELEIPINQNWSIAGEVIFPWWTMDNHKESSRRNRLQLLNGNLEAKYWWGERSTLPLLTGWFAGAYSGIGTYDFEYNARGYQGDILFSCGVSGGYAHAINRDGSLRLEYSVGVGYMTSFYHYYEAEFCINNHWHAVEMRNGRNKWFGPSRAKVSLAWLIDYNNIKDYNIKR